MLKSFAPTQDTRVFAVTEHNGETLNALLSPQCLQSHYTCRIYLHPIHPKSPGIKLYRVQNQGWRKLIQPLRPVPQKGSLVRCQTSSVTLKEAGKSYRVSGAGGKMAFESHSVLLSIQPLTSTFQKSVP